MKILYIIIGFVTLGLGSVGVILPILPTTPFLLVAAFCFAKSSRRLNNWFRQTALYRNNLETLTRGQGMTLASKRRVMLTVSVIMGIAFVAMRRSAIGRICLAVVWVAHIIAFCFVIKTCPADKTEVQPYDDQ